MAIQQPSQYQCDNMEPGDLIYVMHRSWFYKFIRELCSSDKLKLSVKKSLNSNERVEYYQEDCILLREYDLKCVQDLENTVPVSISLSPNKHGLSTVFMKHLKVGLENIQIVLPSGLTLTFPTSFIQDALKSNEHILKHIDNTRLIRDTLRLSNIRGEHFKNAVKTKDLKQFEASYCPVCGKPIIFSFYEDVIQVTNTCDCKNITLNKTEMSYDDLALWYNSATSESERKRNKEYWFGDNANE